MPKKKQKKTDWSQQKPIATWTTDSVRLQTREGAGVKSNGGKPAHAQIGILEDDGSFTACKWQCTVAIGQGNNFDAVLKKYREHYDEEVMEAAEAEREEQGRKAVEAVVAASDEMGLRGGRVALPKSDAPVATAQTVRTCTLTRRKNVVLAAYYQGRARVVRMGWSLGPPRLAPLAHPMPRQRRERPEAPSPLTRAPSLWSVSRAQRTRSPP